MKIYIFMWSMVGFSSFGLQAVLLNLYLVHIGYDATGIGNLLAVAQICFGLAALPAGVIGARFGPRNGLIAGTAQVALGWAIFLSGESLPGIGMGAALQVGLAIANMGQATMIVNGAPYLMCITEDSNRFYYLSFQQAFQALLGLVGGYVAGALPGILAASAGGGEDAAFYRGTLWLIPIGFSLVVLAVTRARSVHLTVPNGANPAPAGQPIRLPWGTFAMYMLVVFLAIVGDNGSRTFFNLYLKDMGLDTRQIGSMYGFNQLAPFLTAISIPAILRRLGTGKTFSAGAILLSFVLFFLSTSTGLLAATVGFFLMALMSTVLQATRSLFGQELVEARWRTFIASVGTISMALGSASSAMLGGYIIPTLGFSSLFRMGAVLVCLSGVLTLAYLNLRARRKNQEPAENPVAG